MGGLWSRLVNTKYEYKIIIQGLDYSGKTTVLYRLKLGEVVQAIPTIGFNVETLTYKNISLSAWDLGGRDKIRPLLRRYYSNTDAMVFIVDSADRERMDQARDELQSILQEDNIRDCPIVVLANKQDLPGAMRTDEITKELELDKAKHNWAIFATCSTQAEGVAEAFDWLISQLGHPDVKTGFVNPVVETIDDVKDSVVQSKVKFNELLQSPYQFVKKCFFFL